MYTMTLAVGNEVVATGSSNDGEQWQQTLLRLFQGTLPAGNPARRIVYAGSRSSRARSATNKVMTGYEDGAGRDVTDSMISVVTEPPQF